MKTEKDILHDAELLVVEAKILKKKKPSLTFYTDAIKIVKVMSSDEVYLELTKAKNDLSQTLDSFDSYLKTLLCLEERMKSST